MSEQTRNLALPYIMAAQAQKHVTHNEALRKLDALVQMAVVDRTHAAPPTTPVESDRYIVAAPATGAWSGHAQEIAAFQDGAWTFATPREGWLAWSIAEAKLFVFHLAAWTEADTSGHAISTGRLGVNTTADTTNRLAVKSDAVLLSHDDVTPGSGDLRVVLNKQSSGATASFMFQTGFSGRAEIGMAGSDKLSFKVSANGSTWTSPIVIDPATGFVGIGTASPAARLDIKTIFGSGIRIGATNTYTALTHFDGGADTMGSFCDYDLITGNATAGAEIRYFRTTNTSGGVGLRICRANGTASSQTLLSANGDSHINGSVGNLGIGTATPSTKLHVAGPVRVASYTVATLPSAATAGAGSMIFVSNETGGATLAYSDGSNWRRPQDRAVVTV